MNSELMEDINNRIVMQLGSMLLQIIQLNAEKAAAERAQGPAQRKKPVVSK